MCFKCVLCTYSEVIQSLGSVPGRNDRLQFATKRSDTLYTSAKFILSGRRWLSSRG